MDKPDVQTGLAAAAAEVRRLEQRVREQVAAGQVRMLPGNACFLEDGRVLCRERVRGDSRYPYGRDGFNFWVYASGYMHGNDGLFFLFPPFQDDLEPPVAFFLGEREAADGTFEPFSLLPMPSLEASESRVVNRYTVIGHEATYFVTETADWIAVQRVFVRRIPAGHAEITFSLLLENVTKRALDLHVSGYINPFCRHQFGQTSEDRWFKKIEVARGGAVGRKPAGVLPPFIVSVNEDISRFRSVTNHALVRRTAVVGSGGAAGVDLAEVCTSRLGYMGSPRIGLGQARCLRQGGFDGDTALTVFNDNAIVGYLNRFVLLPQECARFDNVLSLPGSEEELAAEVGAPLSPSLVDQTFAEVSTESAAAPHDLGLQVSGVRLPGIDDATWNGFLPFLLAQVRVCAETRGYMQPAPNSLIGIRDVFQAIEGYMFDRPQAARRKMLEGLGFVLVDGRCPRQYSLPVNGTPGRADLREFIDQGAWVISTVYTYLTLTGDAGFLREIVGYHRLADARETTIAAADERDSVLEHLLRIMGYLARHRDPATGLVLAMYGDWNDALDGLGTTTDPTRKFGTGVSVMATLQLLRNCTEMMEIAERFGQRRYAAKVAEFSSLREQLQAGLLRFAVQQQNGQRRIVHGWGDDRGYFVGSFRDSDGAARDGLTSNAFWVLAGMLEQSPELREEILQAFDRLDSPFGLKTFEPGFAPDAPGVGRIPKLPIGTAENGAAYLHATLFGVAALFAMGEPRRAWEQIAKTLPFAPHQTGLSHSPFVMPNSYVHNPELNLTGQSMNDWQTGSSNVLLKTLIRGAIGFQPQFDGLRLAPAAWSPFDSYRFRARVQGRSVVIQYAHGDVPQRVFKLNGRPIEAAAEEATLQTRTAYLPYSVLHGTEANVIDVIDPRSA